MGRPEGRITFWVTSPQVNHQTEKFGVHKHCDSGDIKVLVCDPRDPEGKLDQRVIRICGWKPLTVSHHPPMFGHHRHCGSGDIMVLFYLGTSRNYMTKRSCDLMSVSCVFVTIFKSDHHSPY